MEGEGRLCEPTALGLAHGRRETWCDQLNRCVEGCTGKVLVPGASCRMGDSRSRGERGGRTQPRLDLRRESPI